jgi:HEAT repeat protein
MRTEAARACGELEVQKAERELLELLADEEQIVRLAAIFAVGRIGGRRAQAALRAMTQADNAVDAEAANLALEDMLFYGDGDDAVLLEDAEDEEDDNWDLDPWATLDELDDDDFGAYEDD